MSRLGKIPVKLPEKVKVTFANGTVTVEGPKGKLIRKFSDIVNVKTEGDEVLVEVSEDSRTGKMFHGLSRSLLAGMVEGVSKGFKKDLEIVGVGYRAQMSGNTLTLLLGLSHPVVYKIPEGIKITVAENTKLSVEGIDKQLVGEVAATIRRFRKPEPYKGKGVRYAGEHIVMKEGKTVA